MSDRWYLTKFLGKDVAIWTSGSFTDSRILLGLDAVITISHLMLPMRWSCLLILEVGLVGHYILLAVGLKSSEWAQVPFNTVVLSFLVLASALGKRSVERHERNGFVVVAKERMLRAEAEFTFSRQRDSSSHHPHNERDRTEASSIVPSTSPTDKAFEFDPTNEVGRQLEQIMAIGTREHWLFDPAHLRLAPDRVLGSGAYGLVIGGMYKGMPFAAKIPKNGQDAITNGRQLTSLANELRILRRLRHPNIVLLFGAAVLDPNDKLTNDFGYLVLILEHVPGVTLQQWVQDRQAPSGHTLSLPISPDSDRFLILLGMSRALQYLHGLLPCVIHGDLKPSNVLIEMLQNKPRAKLVDFGLSRVLTRRPRPLGGTVLWMAPEVLRQATPNAASDIFSFGRVMYFTVTGNEPFQGMPRASVAAMITKGQPPPLPWVEDCSLAKCCKPLANWCMSLDFKARPTAQDVSAWLERWLLSEDIPKEPNFDLSSDTICSFETIAFHSGLQQVMATMKGKANMEASHAAKAPKHAAVLEVVKEEEKPKASSGSTRKRAKIVEDFRVTPESTREMAITTMLLRWNSECKRMPCCYFHANLEVLNHHVQELRLRSCRKDFLANTREHQQCTNCGLIDVGDVMPCDFCGHGEDSSGFGRQHQQATRNTSHVSL
eukprot:CAMPEP_0206531106 /NCGR_PEP_ID=MMETSP0325_2-20121206/3574_1 /ASSEMBLY_ACC=CAM_ASM_000347 /TAXON_ID=2866 /ORGANISM="Crypthecodinium cohnii, Strain Seligo" /LENGTH=659 /DNA_ID=CAMNT_0054027299 /DNA_START=262 /DNA_END=2241 /DNA_ORIENTATION=+